LIFSGDITLLYTKTLFCRIKKYSQDIGNTTMLFCHTEKNKKMENLLNFAYLFYLLMLYLLYKSQRKSKSKNIVKLNGGEIVDNELAKEGKRLYMQDWRARNKDKVAKYNKAYREKNPEVIQQAKERYFERLALRYRKQDSEGGE
jgi:predicted nucleotidyltransferase